VTATFFFVFCNLLHLTEPTQEQVGELIDLAPDEPPADEEAVDSEPQEGDMEPSEDAEPQEEAEETEEPAADTEGGEGDEAAAADGGD
jgi:hypothetical protein